MIEVRCKMLRVCLQRRHEMASAGRAGIGRGQLRQQLQIHTDTRLDEGAIGSTCAHAGLQSVHAGGHCMLTSIINISKSVLKATTGLQVCSPGSPGRA
jgi:hypothetical protein